jgi:hypothetical protein
MLTLNEQVVTDAPEWKHFAKKLQTSVTLASLVLTAWQIGLWFAKTLVEQQLNQRAKQPENWSHCAKCGVRLHSKGFANRRMLTLVGWVEWQRRIGRCPNRCKNSHSAPFDAVLSISAYQQTSIELKRLGCLLRVFLPFELAVQVLQQMCGIRLGDDTLWQWVQTLGQQAMEQLEGQLQHLAAGNDLSPEPLQATLATLPLVIAADGVTVPFRPTPETPKGKIRFQEIKVAVLARLGQRLTQTGNVVSRLHQRRFVAVLGDLNTLQSRLHLEALRQGIKTAPQVVWISDGARGFWRLFEQHFAAMAVGSLDFYHAVGQLWQAAEAYGNTVPHRTPQQWFGRLRHQLRHGFVRHIIQEFAHLLRYTSTPDAAKPTLQRVQNYLSTHIQH